MTTGRKLGGLVVRILAFGTKGPEFKPQVVQTKIFKIAPQKLKLVAFVWYKIHTVFHGITYGFRIIHCIDASDLRVLRFNFEKLGFPLWGFELRTFSTKGQDPNH